METSSQSVLSTTADETQNITNNQGNYTKQWDWIIPMVLSIIFIVLALWILLSLVHYGIKTGKWNSHHQRSSEKLNIGEIYTSVVITAAICICFLCVNTVYINVGFNAKEEELCNTFSDVTAVVYFLELFSVCMFLWLRQRVFYKNFMLNADYNKTIRFLSSSSIIFILLFGVAALVLNVLPNDMTWSQNGCLYNPSDEYKVWYWVTAVMAVGFGQCTLVSLFAYGLKKTSRERWISKQLCCYGSEQKRPSVDLPSSQVDSSKSHSFSTSQSFGSKSESRKISTSSSTHQIENQSVVVQRILWKTLIFAVLTILSVFIFQVVSHYLVPSNSHRRLSAIVANLDATFNVLFVIFSFVKWKEILTTFCNQ